MIKHLKIKIYGEVQGVGFRYNTNRLAKKLGVFGYVANASDGTLILEAEGEKDLLDELLKWSQKGPSSATIEKVETEWSDQLVGYNQFEIR